MTVRSRPPARTLAIGAGPNPFAKPGFSGVENVVVGRNMLPNATNANRMSP
jgi:hypothetical protein